MINRNGYKAPKNNKTGNFPEGISYNPFAPLHDCNIECHKCNNLGHKAHDCRSSLKSPLKENVVASHEEKPNKSWKKEQEKKKKEECNLVMYVENKEI